MKKFAKAASAALCVVAAICLALVLLMTSVQMTGLNKNYFMRSHEKLGTAQTIGASEETVEMITEALVDYLKGDREDLDMQADIALRGGEKEVFTEVEKLHMVDVYFMFRAGFIARDWCLAIAALSLIGAFFLAKENYAKRCAKSMLVTYGVMAAALAVVIFWVSRDFTRAFFFFHEVSFSNDMWLLDRSLHVLINLVPEVYFSTIARDIMLIFAAGIVLVCVLCVLALTRRKKVDEGAL